MATSGSLLGWVTDSLVGLPLPGQTGSLHADLVELEAAGVGLLITLTEEPPTFAAQLSRIGLASRHFPVRAWGIPDLDATAALCEEVGALLAQGTKVAFHCWAGLGRTGTLLACQLVWNGMAPAAAIAQVRQAIPNAIETAEQAQFVHELAARLATFRVTLI
jgi:atypical dual specificity phosphatase